MSIRTNLTLSATTNRLNLGSRSLVLVTGQNDKATLRFRHAFASHQGISARREPMIMQPQPSDIMPAYKPAGKPDGKRGNKPTGGFRSFGSPSGSTSWLTYSWQELLLSSIQGCLSLEAPPVHIPVVVTDVPSSVREVSRPRTRTVLASRSARSAIASAAPLAPAAAS